MTGKPRAAAVRTAGIKGSSGERGTSIAGVAHQRPASDATPSPGPVAREIFDIPLDRLKFDLLNPRLPTTVSKTPDRILRWMLSDATLLELMRSIGAQGYFAGEPILVASDPNAEAGDARFLVVEGNRRFAAALLLREPELAPVRQAGVKQAAAEARFRPDALPAVKFSKRDDVMNYLGFRHVTGIKPWDPLAKARYVKQLLGRPSEAGAQNDYKEVARRIGSRSDYVEKLLRALALYERVVDRNFYNLKGLDEREIEFSLLTTALSYSTISDWLGADEPSVDGDRVNDENLKALVDWMYREVDPGGKTVLGESRNLRVLAEIVQFPTAVADLKQRGSLSAAAQLSGEPTKVLRSSLGASREAILQARDQVHLVQDVGEQDIATAGEISTLARDVATLLRSRLIDADST